MWNSLHTFLVAQQYPHAAALTSQQLQSNPQVQIAVFEWSLQRLGHEILCISEAECQAFGRGSLLERQKCVSLSLESLGLCKAGALPQGSQAAGLFADVLALLEGFQVCVLPCQPSPQC